MSEPALPLAIPTQPSPPRRPSRHDDAVRREAVTARLADIKEWLQDPKISDDELIADVATAIRRNDGFAAAQAMAELGYTPDAQLVDLLDGIDTYHIIKRHVAAWVEANGIRPEFQPGQRILWTRRGKAGVVRQVIATVAEYMVLLDEDIPKVASGHIATVLPFEDVEAEPISVKPPAEDAGNA